MRADLGIMISASHNTYEYNGIKIFGPDGYKLDDRDELEIEGILGNIDSYDLSSRMVGKAKGSTTLKLVILSMSRALLIKILALMVLRLSLIALMERHTR